MMKTFHFSLLILLLIALVPVAFAIESDVEDTSCRPLDADVETQQTCCQNSFPFNSNPIVAIKGICQYQPSGCAIKNESQELPFKRCCEGLLPDDDNLCKDMSPVDSTLTSCEGSNAVPCGPGLGCFQQRNEDVFSQIPNNENEASSLSLLQQQLESENGGEPRPSGQFCIKNSQCVSYNCVPKASGGSSECKETKICRQADVGEVAGTASCMKGMIVNTTSGKCEVIPATIQGPITGSTDPIKNKCSFHFPSDMKAKVEYAIAQTRAMEWFLNSMESNNDCLNNSTYLNSIGQKFISKRRELLKMFNEGMKKIDGNQKILLASKDPQTDPNAVVSIHGSTLTNKQLAGRLTSGADMLQVMFERNLVFQAYEKEMNLLTNLTLQRIKALEDRFDLGENGWGDHQRRSWTIPRETGVSADGLKMQYEVQTYVGSGATCRGGGFLGLARRRVYKRWHHQYMFNSKIFNDVNIKSELSRIVYPEKVTLSLTGGGNSIISAADTSAAEAALSQVTGLPNGRNYFALDSANSFRDYPSVRNSFLDYVAGLKSDPTLSSFNHEPELLALEAKDCASGNSTGACSKYSTFIDQISRIGFAQMYAYSTHHRDNYKFFFNGDVWRKKLFMTWMGNLDYLTGYYKSMVQYRTEQNKCLSTAGDDANSMIDNSMSGINEGAKNYYAESDYTGAATGQANATAAGQVFNSKNSFEFQANLLKGLSWNNNSNLPGANESASGAGSSTLTGVSSASLASRVKTATDLSLNKNAKGISSGPGAKAPGIIQSSLPGSDASSGSSESSNSLSATEIGKASLMDEMQMKGEGTTSTEFEGPKGLVKSNGASGTGTTGYGGGSAFGSNSTVGITGESKAGKDPTGMSDEEKDIMMANFERTKSRYDTNEDDSLFTIINKTYVRNLDKILKKKPSASAE